MWTADPASRALGIELQRAEAGLAETSMTVTATMLNGLDVCHGGWIFALADTALAFAANAQGENALTTHAGIEYLQPAPEGAVLTATAIERHPVGRKAIFDVEVHEGGGALIATVRGAVRRPRPADELLSD